MSLNKDLHRMAEPQENVSTFDVVSGLTSSANIPPGYSLVHTAIIASLVSIILIIIVFGNLLVVLAIATDRQLKSIQNWFIASLAVADLSLGLVIMPFSLANELMQYWYFGPVWCDLWKAVDVFLCTASILSICLISLDRYWSITRALQYSRQRTSKRVALMITAVWVLSAIICVPPLIGWKNPLPISEYPLCLLSSEIGYVISSCMGSFYIPAVIMVVVYVKIYFAVKERARRSNRKRQIKNEATVARNSDHERLNGSQPMENKQGNQEIEQKSVISEDESTWPVYKKQTSNRPSIEIPEESTSLLQKSQGKKLPDLLVVPATGKAPHTETTDIHGHDVIMEQKCLLQISNNAKQNETKIYSESDKRHPSTEESYLSSSSAYDDPESQDQNEAERDLDPKKNGKISVGEITTLSDIERQKRKLAKARERRATIVLGLVMAAFIFCWFPFFTIYIVTSLCDNCVPEIIFTIAFWAGYCNSALNPIIYTIFNQDFRNAFRKIIFKKALFKR